MLKAMRSAVRIRRAFWGTLAIGFPTVLVAVALAEPSVPSVHQEPTFADDIGPLIQQRCTMCHDNGGHGPFRLSSYRDVSRRSTLVRQEILKRTMPPCYATSDVGEFCQFLPLTDEQIVQFQKWLRAGMPAGEDEDQPVAPARPEDWRVPDPDLVVQPVVTPVAPEEGNPVWKAVLIDPGNKETIRIRGFDVRPSAVQATRHILLAVASDKVTEPQWETQMTLDDYSDRLIGSWAPGYRPWMLPKGTSMTLRPGEKLIAQVLFQPSGKPEDPKLEIALYLSEDKMDKEPYWITLEKKQFRIAPYDESVLSESTKLDRAVNVISVVPEARFFANAMTTSAKLPNGEVKKLFHTIRWTPYWIGNYMFSKPVELDAGTVITTDVFYGNEEHSPLNEGNRPKTVRSGPGLYDEVCRTHILVVDR